MAIFVCLPCGQKLCCCKHGCTQFAVKKGQGVKNVVSRLCSANRYRSNRHTLTWCTHGGWGGTNSVRHKRLWWAIHDRGGPFMCITVVGHSSRLWWAIHVHLA